VWALVGGDIWFLVGEGIWVGYGKVTDLYWWLEIFMILVRAYPAFTILLLKVLVFFGLAEFIRLIPKGEPDSPLEFFREIILRSERGLEDDIAAVLDAVSVWALWVCSEFTGLLYLIAQPIILLTDSLLYACQLFSQEGVVFNFGFGAMLIASSLIFAIGAFGIAFNRKNILLLMASIEIMFLGINLVFISGYVCLNLEVGLIYALVTLSVAAAEAAIGFSLVMSSFRNSTDITIKGFNRLKGKCY
jgi:NADH-quinone oxidoreductase subunit K